MNVFLWEDLRDVTLVGHSYAGWVITAAVERLQDRVAAMVYLNAFLPRNGDCGYHFLNEQQKAALTRPAQRRGLAPLSSGQGTSNPERDRRRLAQFQD